MTRKTNAGKISILALFAAIIIIQNFVPLLGYIPVGVFVVTTIHITVIIAAIVLGPVDGAIVGGIWGVVDWIKAITLTSSPFSNVVMVNPMVSIVPRILIGLIAGLLVNWLIRINVKQQLSLIMGSIMGSLVNTVLVLSMIYVFFHNGSGVYAALNIKELMPYLLTVAGVHGIPEAIAAGIIAPLISIPLLRYSKVGQERFRELDKKK
jgi:uncharacterized membrane protein